MGIKQYQRHSRQVILDRRWPALRIQVLRRDGFQCVQCGSRYRLQVDHIEPVRDAPEQSFNIGNLQTLCPSCHSAKTRAEVGLSPPDPERQKWRDLLKRY